MELLPGTYFEIEGKGVEYVGVPKNQPEASTQDVVVKINPFEKDEALHKLVPLREVEEKGTNFWNLGEKLRHSELARQYHEQILLLHDAGVLKELSTGKKGIIGIDNKEYPVPQFDAIKNHLLIRQSELRLKIEQGFSSLLLTPFAMKVTDLADIYQSRLLHYFVPDPSGEGDGTVGALRPDMTRSRLKAVSHVGSSLCGLNIYEPVVFYNYSPFSGGVDKNGSLEDTKTILYYPKTIIPSNDPQAKTKRELLENQPGSFPGWHVSFMQKFTETIPFDDHPLRLRLPFRSSMAAADTYIEAMETDPKYAYESPMILEEWFTYALTNLEVRGEVTDVTGVPASSSNHSTALLGNYINSSNVIRAYWYDSRKQVVINGERDFTPKYTQLARSVVTL